MDQLPIIDVHVHTSDRPLSDLHVADASLSAIEAAAKRLGIETLFILATYFPFKGKGLHNQELLKRIKDFPRARAIGSLDFMGAYDDHLAELSSLAQAGQLAGIKLYPGYQKFEFSDERVWRVLRLAEHHQLPVTIHGGELHHCCSAKRRAAGELACKNTFCWIDQLGHLSHPSAFVERIRQFPLVTFVIAHLANPYFDDLRALMREYPNVVTDISGQFVSGTAEDTPAYRAEIVYEIERFVHEIPDGSNRLLFGSDFPIQSFEDTIDLVQSLRVSGATKRAIFAGNARRVYHLEGGVA